MKDAAKTTELLLFRYLMEVVATCGDFSFVNGPVDPTNFKRGHE
jgi:hypothetical protein